MDYKKQYFSSGEEYKQRSFLYIIKKKLFSNRNTKRHYGLILLNRWANLRSCKKVLDLGCGIGEFIKINPYKKEVHGMDVIPETVKALKKQGFKVKLGDLYKKLPYKNNAFDGINLSHVLEHLDDPTNTINEIKRVLMDKGKVMIIVPNFSFKEFHNDYTHKKPYRKMSLYRLLRDNGFIKIRVENGPFLNNVFLSILFFGFPKMRFSIEKFFGIFSPSEYIATAVNNKGKLL